MEVAENHHHGRSEPENGTRGAGRHWKQSRWAAAALLLAITAGFYWRLTLTNQFTWLDGADLANQVLPWFQFQVGEIQRGRVPLWDPYHYGGQSLIGQAQPGVAYPLNWVLIALPTRHGWMKAAFLHWYFVVIHFMAVGFAYWLCRDIGLGRPAAVLGGIVFGLGGYMGQIDWPQMLNGAVWAPLVLMFLLRCERGERTLASAARGGVCLGMSFLSGHHQVPIYLVLMAGAVWLWLALREASRFRAMAALALLFFCVAGATGALQILPAWEYSQRAVRWVGLAHPIGHSDVVPYTIHDQFSLKAPMILGLVVPGIQGLIYTGASALALAALGVAAAWSRREVRIATAVAVGGLAFAFGSELMWHGVIYGLAPMVDKARSPAMASIIFTLGLAVLAACGLDRMTPGPPAVWLSRVQKALIGMGVLTTAGALAYYIQHKGVFDFDMRFVLAGLEAMALAGILGAWRRGALSASAAAICASGLVLTELASGAVSYLPNRQAGFKHLPALAEGSEIARAVAGLAPRARIEIKEGMAHNMGDWYGIEMWAGYVASIYRKVKDLHLHDIRTRELYGVRYLVAREPDGPWRVPVAELGGGLRIFENPGALPRAWVVHDVVGNVTSEGEADRLLSERGAGPMQRGFVSTTAPDLESCRAPEFAFVERWVTNAVRITAELGCRGMVVVSDNYDPGWRAWVDGKPAEILEAYGGLRGVVADRGRRTIEMKFQPSSVMAGLALTLAGLAAGVLAGRARG